MIYGPYTTGWRAECDRRNAKRRAAWARAGVVVVLAAFVGALRLAGVV